MSRIDDLMAEHAPDGVRVQTLGDVGEFIRGNGLQKSDLTDEGAPAIHYGQLHTYYGVWTDSTKSFTHPGLAAKLRRARFGDLIIVTTSEDDAAVAKATAWLGGCEVAVSGDAYIYRHSLDPRYAAYFFQSTKFQSQKSVHISGTKVRRISGTSLAKIVIPVPPLEVQREIVRILDHFTQLTAELEAELEARRRQYEHYRDLLVSKKRFSSNEWVPLSALATIRTGSKPEAISSSGEIPYVNAGLEPSGFTSASNTRGGVVTIPSRGQGGAGHVGYQDADFWCGPLCYRVDSNSSASLNRFLFFFLKNIQEEIVGLRKIGSIPAVNKSDLAALLFPVVDIKQQRHIVGVLDRLDAIVNDASIGLPAEIAARRKQYEHYREKLFTFEAAAV